MRLQGPHVPGTPPLRVIARPTLAENAANERRHVLNLRSRFNRASGALDAGDDYDGDDDDGDDGDDDVDDDDDSL